MHIYMSRCCSGLVTRLDERRLCWFAVTCCTVHGFVLVLDPSPTSSVVAVSIYTAMELIVYLLRGG